MISAELLEILRCPMDPRRQSRLKLVDDRLVCEQCGGKFPIKDGFPVMVVQEVELPAGVADAKDLAGRHQLSPPAD